MQYDTMESARQRMRIHIEHGLDNDGAAWQEAQVEKVYGKREDV